MFVHCFVFSFQIPFKPSFSYVSSVLVVVSSFHHLYPHKTSYIKGSIIKETKYNVNTTLQKDFLRTFILGIVFIDDQSDWWLTML